MSTKKFGIVAGIALALSVVVSGPVSAACSLTTMSECDNNGLMALIVQLLSGSTTTTTTTTGAAISGIPAGFTFTTNLKQGSTGNDVKYLQILLNSDAATSVGNAGSETSYFGAMTKAAVVKFQNKYKSEVLTPYGLSAGTGFFGTSSRAKANALIAAGVSTGTTTTTTGTGVGTTPVTGLNVALSSSTPVAASLAKGAVATPVATFAISSQTATTLDSIKFTRTGLGAASDYNNVYIYNNGTRLKSGRAISSDSQTVEFTNVALAIPANTIVNLTVAVDVAADPTSTTGDVNTMGIASASDVKFVGGATPNGSFPLNGNAMTISSVSIGTAIIAAGSTPSNPSIGATDVLVTEMKVTAGSDDITLNKISLTQNGTINSSNLSNIQLKLDSTVLATTASMTGDRVTLTLTTPYTIGKNKNKTFGIYADITGGKSGDVIRFYLEENSDVSITDTKYNQGANVTITAFGSAHTSKVATQGGEITLTDKGPAANTISRNKTDVDLLKFGVVTSRNVTVKDYNLTLTHTAKADTTTSTTSLFAIGTPANLTVGSSAGFAVDDYVIVDTDNSTTATSADMIAKVTAIPGGGATLTVSPVDGTDLTPVNGSVVSTVIKVTGVRLVNVDTGSVLYSNSTNRYFSTLTQAGRDNQAASDDFDMNIGTTYNFAVRVDISEYAAPGMLLKGGVELDTASDIKDYDANEYVLPGNIVPNTIVGKNMTIGATNLSVTRASTPVSTTKVKGTQDVDALGISVNAGSSGDVKISQVVVRFNADVTSAAGFTNGTGDTAANTVIDSVSLYDENGKIAGPKSLSSVGWVADTADTYYKATFDNLSYTIASGASKKLTVKVNLKSTVAADTWFYANVAPATDITAKDSDGNTLTLANATFGGINENDGDSTVGNDADPATVIKVSTTGNLALKAEGSPSAAIVAAGATNVVMSKYKLSATDEAYVLDKLSIASDTNSNFATAENTLDNNITQVGIRVNGGTPVKANLSNGVANFSNLAVTVPADGYVYIEVLADFNTIAGGAISGATPRLGIYQIGNAANTFRAVGQGSSTTVDYNTAAVTTGVTGTANVYSMTVRKTMPTIAKHAGMSTTLANGTNAIYAFDVAADSHEAVALKRVKLTFQGSTANLNVNGLKLYRGTTDLTDNVLIYQKGVGNGTAESGGSTDIIENNDGITTNTELYIVWDGTTEEVIPAGQTYVYTVYAAVGGVQSNYNITAYIADDAAATAGTATGIAAIGGYQADSGKIYHAASTTVAAGDVRITAQDKFTPTASTTAGFTTGEGNGFASKAYGITTGRTIVVSSDGTGLAEAVGGTIVSTDSAACKMYQNDGTTEVAVGAAIADVRFVECTTTTGNIRIQATAGDDSAGENYSGSSKNITYLITKTTFDSGSVALATDSDFGLTVTASTTNNLVWSDNSVTTHDFALTSGSSDWASGYLVDNLSTSLLSLTAP